jgi:hypothetical protein
MPQLPGSASCPGSYITRYVSCCGRSDPDRVGSPAASVVSVQLYTAVSPGQHAVSEASVRSPCLRQRATVVSTTVGVQVVVSMVVGAKCRPDEDVRLEQRDTWRQWRHARRVCTVVLRWRHNAAVRNCKNHEQPAGTHDEALLPGAWRPKYPDGCVCRTTIDVVGLRQDASVRLRGSGAVGCRDCAAAVRTVAQWQHVSRNGVLQPVRLVRDDDRVRAVVSRWIWWSSRVLRPT